MTEGKIFISYRRADASGYAGRIFDRLSARFGEENIFMDVEGLSLGVDFHEALDKAVSACNILIALIGKQWLDIKDENGKRRLDDPEDFVRIEIAAALNRDIRVIPILVQDAQMPESKELPEVLQRLARYNGMEIRHERFNADADRLVRGIEECFQEDAERREREAIEKAAREKADREQAERELSQQETQIAKLLKKADTAIEQEDWQTAQSNYRQVLELHPDHVEAQEGFQIASRQLELARLYGKAILHREDGHLERALRSLRRIQGLNEDYRDVPAMIVVIEGLIAEQAQKISSVEEYPKSDWRKSLLERLNSLPRGLWYLGGVTGFILMIVIAVWGVGKVLNFYRGTETQTPTINTYIGMVETGTNTPKIATETEGPVRTSTPVPTFTITFITDSTQTPAFDLPQQITDDYGVTMALVPAGTFEMAFDSGSKFRSVTLDEFYIDQYEVTNSRYAECIEAGYCDEPNDYGSATRDSYFNVDEYSDYPVIYVTWDDAQAYCEWRGSRLPTEAEWEKAARGDFVEALYPWGNDEPTCETGQQNGAQFFDCEYGTVPVGSFSANSYGLYDVAGNVWEWVADWFTRDVSNSPSNNPTGPDTGSYRVMRGGGLGSGKINLNLGYRGNLSPDKGYDYVGFRCASDGSSFDLPKPPTETSFSLINLPTKTPGSPPKDFALIGSTVLEGHTTWVMDLAWSPDGKIIASTGRNQDVRLWQVSNGSLIQTLEIASFKIAWSPDGQFIAGGGYDGVLRVWRLSDYSLSWSKEAHSGSITGLAWSPDGQTLASGGWDGDKTLKLWQANDGSLIHSITDHTTGIYDVTWSPDGQTIASLSKNGFILLNRMNDFSTIDSFSHPPQYLGTTYDLEWSPDSQTIASSSSNNTIRLWQVSDGTVIRELKSQGCGISGTAWSPDSQIIASEGASHTIELLRLIDDSSSNTTESHLDCINSLKWSPDGRTLASGSRDTTVRLWQLEDVNVIP